MLRGKSVAVLLLSVFAVFWLVGSATAGPGSVEVQAAGDILIKMGAQIRIIPTSEVNRDFGVSTRLSPAEEAAAAGAMRALGVGTTSTRVHLNEAGGAVKDDHIRGENRLFFNFIRGTDWDVYMALESDTVLDRKSADRTDFATGRQTQQFGIERLMATFNMPWVSSRLEAGWDARGADIGYAGLVYGDDDPGIGIVGGASGFKWEARYIKKDEDEAGYYVDPVKPAVNPIDAPSNDRDTDRTFCYGKLGYDFSGTYLEAFGFYDRNYMGKTDIDHYFTGLQGKGTYGILMPTFELVYTFGDYEAPGQRDRDISSWAAYADLAVDLREMANMQKFEVHVGGYYVKGDDDLTDDDLEGFASSVGIDRFSPRFGSEQSISFDGNPILGQTLYSMLPIYYGSVRGAGINGGAALDGPGFIMFGGGLKTAYNKWTYITNVMAMWFETTEPVETYYANAGAGAPDIDDFMGVEWNNEVWYCLYKAVTLKAGAAFLFPGSGAKDITKALDAIARGVNFSQGRSSDDISMRFAAELLWFF